MEDRFHMRLFLKKASSLFASNPSAPYLLCALFVLSAFTRMITGVTLADALVGAGFVIVAPSILLLLLRLCGIRGMKAAIVSILLLFPILYTGPIVALLSSITLSAALLRYDIPAMFLVSFALSIGVLRSPRSFVRIHQWLSTTLFFLCIAELFALPVNQARASYAGSPDMYYGGEKFAAVPMGTVKRNIVYIVLDAHTSARSLKQIWNFDEEDFINNLEKRGFYVVRESKSFNAVTYRSQASTLNMSSARELGTLEERSVLQLLNKCTTAKFLSHVGYEIYNYSPFEILDKGSSYPIALWEEQEDDAWIRVFYNSLPAQLALHYYAIKLPQILEKIRQQSAAQILMPGEKPGFYYAHFLSPHPPYIYDSTGGVIPWFQRKPAGDKDGYLENLRGNDRLVISFIDTLLSAPGPKPIIVLQGDHGSRLFRGTPHEYESYTILNAYHFPDMDRSLLNDHMSPYNTFRVIFNFYFGQHFSLLANGVHVGPLTPP